MTEYDTLKHVVVGIESYENTKIVDTTLKHFFKDNIRDYYRDENFNSYHISDKLLLERKQDIDNLCDVLIDNNIKVTRPAQCGRLKSVKTPHFSSVYYSNSNVRDLTLTLDDCIITAQTTVRSRYFENTDLNEILYDQFIKNDKKLISPPLATLCDNKLDFIDWKIWSSRNDHVFDDRYEILFDAANCIKVTDEDIMMNIGNQNHYNGYLWLTKVLPHKSIHPVHLCDNHIDGTILPLRHGVFLANTCYLDGDIKDYLPNKFKSWKIIEVNDRKLNPEIYDKTTLSGPQLASYEGIDINVLSISPDTVIVQDTATRVIDSLLKNGFNVIPIQFRHGTVFGGGIHCTTLDLERVKNE